MLVVIEVGGVKVVTVVRLVFVVECIVAKCGGGGGGECTQCQCSHCYQSV